MLRFWIVAISTLALHAAVAADKSAQDNRANQLNPNNDAYWSSRGMGRPSSNFDDDEKAARGNRANQLNPNNGAYWSSRGMGRPSSNFDDDEKAARGNRANQPNPNYRAYGKRLMRDIEAITLTPDASRRAAERNCNAAIDATQRNYEAALHTAQRAAIRDRGKPGFHARLDAIATVKRDYVKFRAFHINLILDRNNLDAARRDYRAAVVALRDAGSDRDDAGRSFRAAVVALAAAGRKWDARLALCQATPWRLANSRVR